MLELTPSQVDLIRQDAQRCYPDECCGILFGILDEDKKSVREVAAIQNNFSDDEKFHRFLITPDTMRKAELDARKKHLDVVGFYHSHPDCPAIPSEYDRVHAFPVYSYIIASVLKGKTAEVNCWELDAQSRQFHAERQIICQ